MLSLQAAADMEASLVAGRQGAHTPRLLPSVRESRRKRASGCVKSIPRQLPGIFLVLSGLEGPLTLGQGEGISQALAGVPHPLPSKTCLVCQTFSGGNAATLRWVWCAALDNLFQGTWCFGARWFGALFCRRMQRGGASAPRWIMPTRMAMFCPWLAPRRNGIAGNRIELGKRFARYAFATQHKTVGTPTSSMCRSIVPRTFSACTLLRGQRTYISHVHRPLEWLHIS